jgi:hypothetical protein
MKWWNTIDFDCQDVAEQTLHECLSSIVETYVNKVTPKTYGPAPWWNYKCQKAFKFKTKCFDTKEDDPERFIKASKLSTKVQRMAFKEYNGKIKKRLDEMSTSDKNFWSIIKELSGLDSSRSDAAPSVDDLADHFAAKMSNGKGDDDDGYTPNDNYCVPLSSFKIRFKSVRKSLRRLDPSKSTNGLGNCFLKECADEIAPSITRLFKLIVRKSAYVSRWKIQRVSPAHKRGKKTDPTKYRPISVIDNLSSVFEDTIKFQFEAWIHHFIPDWQFGFLPDCGTTDYGAALTFTMQDCLERRKQGVLIPTDIKGAFDRCWWKRLKNRLQKKGMRKRALTLIKNYLFRRFLRVVANGSTSEKKEIFSSVPQGGKLSAPLWDFDISELGDKLSAELVPFGYADDVALWFEVKFDRVIQTAVINTDLEALAAWGDDNKTTFEPEKMSVLVVSQKRNPYDASGITFNGEELRVLDDATLVGLKIDPKLRWGPMVDKLAVKARQRLGALSRVRHLLDSRNMCAIYTMFIRSIMEYNCVSWMGTAQTHLDKLDRIQASAQKIGGFKIESLQCRREAATVAFALKLMSGKARGELNNFVPKVIEPLKLTRKRTRNTLEGNHIKAYTNSRSLETSNRGFHGALPNIWRKIPQDIISKGSSKGWLSISNDCKDFLTGKGNKKHQKVKKIKVDNDCNEIYNTKLNNELNGTV